jgi:hypothetical protein
MPHKHKAIATYAASFTHFLFIIINQPPCSIDKLLRIDSIASRPARAKLSFELQIATSTSLTTKDTKYHEGFGPGIAFG